MVVLALRALGGLPPSISRPLAIPALPFYRSLRRRHLARIRACFAASPFAASLGPGAYYRRRLELLLLGLRAHGRNVTAAFPQVEIEGEPAYAQALASGHPVVLLGLHLGPWELLHRLPPAPEGRPFAIVTATAFAPALTAFMAGGRERGGKRVLWIGKAGPQGLQAGLRSCLAANGVLAVMADQHPGPAETCEWLRLWGRIRIPYPGRLLRFLERRGCLFVPVSARMAGNSAVLRYHGIWPAAGPERVRAYLEAAIAAAPDQWNWSYPKVNPADSRGVEG